MKKIAQYAGFATASKIRLFWWPYFSWEHLIDPQPIIQQPQTIFIWATVRKSCGKF